MRQNISKELNKLQTTIPFTYQFISFVFGDVINVAFSFIYRKGENYWCFKENQFAAYLSTNSNNLKEIAAPMENFNIFTPQNELHGPN